MGQDGTDAKRVTTTLTMARKRALKRLAEREGVKDAWFSFVDVICRRPCFGSRNGPAKLLSRRNVRRMQDLLFVNRIADPSHLRCAF